MRRAIQTIIAYLAIGLFATVAVAWGLALLPPGTNGGGYDKKYALDNDLYLYCEYNLHRGFGSERIGFSAHESTPQDYRMSRLTGFYGPLFVGPREQWAAADWRLQFDAPDRTWGLARPNRLAEGDSIRLGIDDARGLPFLALTCSWPVSFQPFDTVVVPPGLQGGIELPDAPGPIVLTGKFRALPYRPIWSGLALNTVIYGVLFFTLVRAVRFARAKWRCSRGLCPRCAYDRLDDYSTPCPECGHRSNTVAA